MTDFCLLSEDIQQNGESPAKRETKSIRLTRFAAHNAFHHCEQCQHYCEAGPAAQVSTSSEFLRRTYVHPKPANTYGELCY